MQMIPMLENDAVLLPLCARRNHALAALAEQALIAEAELTPKPGLVDRSTQLRDVRFTACWFRTCRFKQRATIPPLTLPEDDTAGHCQR